MKRYLGLAMAPLFLVACTGTSPDTDSAGEKKLEYRTARGKGKHGLQIDVRAPREVKGGQLFKINYGITDDEGDLSGVLIEWGDGKTWGGMPSDLVCSSTTGQANPAEGSTSENEEMSHAYRSEGTYEVSVGAYTGGCFAHWDRTRVTLEVDVVGVGDELNGPMPPRATIGHAYYTNGDPSVLVSDIGGYDEDGFVQRIAIDWGDGSTQVLDQPMERCDVVHGNYPGGWFSQPTKHRYEKPGDYLVKIEVASVGCDGKTSQTDSAQRTLEFPPEQGS